MVFRKLRLIVYFLFSWFMVGCSQQGEVYIPDLKTAYAKPDLLAGFGLPVDGYQLLKIEIKKVTAMYSDGKCIFDLQNAEYATPCANLYADSKGEFVYSPFEFNSRRGKYIGGLYDWNLNKVKDFGLETGWLKESSYWSSQDQFETEEEYRVRAETEEKEYEKEKLREKMSHTYEIAIVKISDLSLTGGQHNRVFYNADKGGWALDLGDIRGGENIKMKTVLNETMAIKERQILRIDNVEKINKALNVVKQDRDVAKAKGWRSDYEIVVVFRVLNVSDESNITSCADVGFGYGQCIEQATIYRIAPLYIGVDLNKGDLISIYRSDEMKRNKSDFIMDLAYVAYGIPDVDKVLLDKSEKAHINKRSVFNLLKVVTNTD